MAACHQLVVPKMHSVPLGLPEPESWHCGGIAGLVVALVLAERIEPEGDHGHGTRLPDRHGQLAVRTVALTEWQGPRIGLLGGNPGGKSGRELEFGPH